MFIHKFDALQARGLLRSEHCTSFSETSIWICTGKLSDDACWLIFFFFFLNPHECVRHLLVTIHAEGVFLKKIFPGPSVLSAWPNWDLVFEFLTAPLRALFAAYQLLLVYYITHDCVGNDSSYSFVCPLLRTAEPAVCWIEVHIVAFEFV